MPQSPKEQRSRQKYSDPVVLLSAIKHYEKDLEIDWKVVMECSVTDLQRHAELIRMRLENLSKDKVLAELGSKFLLYSILRARTKGA